MEKKKINTYLYIAGILSFAVALLHILIIMGGPDWYRFFGAGEGIAQLAENGSTYPTILTVIIVVVFTLWGLFAFSGAGLIRKLPLLKLALIIISTIYILRGILGIPFVFYVDNPYLNELAENINFMIISSVISLGIGLLYFLGLIQVWPNKLK